MFTFKLDYKSAQSLGVRKPVKRKSAVSPKSVSMFVAYDHERFLQF